MPESEYEYILLMVETILTSVWQWSFMHVVLSHAWGSFTEEQKHIHIKETLREVGKTFSFQIIVLSVCPRWWCLRYDTGLETAFKSINVYLPIKPVNCISGVTEVQTLT